MPNTNSQLVIIGAGPGGYAAAFFAADHDIKVTLVDTEINPGGVCLYRGCIPSKAFLHVAKVLNEAKEAKNFGVEFAEPKIDVEKVRNWKQGVVQKLTGGLGMLTKQRKITFIQGRAVFQNAHSLKIQKTKGGEEVLNFDTAIIATGSRPTTIPNFPASPQIMNSTDALELKEIPKNLLVVGGGYIGLELGTVYAALGTKVTVVEMMPALLLGVDRDLRSVLERRLKEKFHAILTDTKVTAMTETPQGIKVTFDGANVAEKEQIFEKVLVAVGRKPNSSGLGLENTKVQIDQRGFITINGARQTAEPNIYAIGDVAGDPMLAHKASHEGRVAVEAIIGKKVAFEPQAIPAVVFTDPEIAWCGLTELDAEKKNIPIKIAKFSWGASGRALTLDRHDGLTKLILNPETERVLGVGIAGVGASELIAEGVLAVEMGALASDIQFSIHPHPTLSETFMESAEAFYGHSTHTFQPRKK